VGSWLGVLVVFVAGCAVVSGLGSRNEMRTFLGSNFVIVGLLATGATALFPVMLYSTLAPENSLTAYSVASSSNGSFPRCHLVACSVHTRGDLFHLHLASLQRESQRSPRQSGLLLGLAFVDMLGSFYQ
jgi:hypothetical protein